MKIFDENMPQKKSKGGQTLGLFLTMGIAGAYIIGGPELFLPQTPKTRQDVKTPHNKFSEKNKKKSLFGDPLSIFKGKDITLSNWATLPQSDEWYDKWRVSPGGINDLKEVFAKDPSFNSKLTTWAQNTKRDFMDWKKVRGSKEFAKWRQKNSSLIWLSDQYNASSTYNEDMAKWINLGPSKRSLANWKLLKINEETFEKFIQTPQGQKKLQTIYQTKPSYVTDSAQWITHKNLTEMSQNNWFSKTDFTTKYNQWKSSMEGSKILTKEWKQNGDYDSKFITWLQSVYARKNQEEWLNSSASNEAYKIWQNDAANQNDLKTLWKTTTNYTQTRDRWISKNYTKQTKDQWQQLPTARNSFQSWFNTYDQVKLKDYWQTTSDYLSSKKTWADINLPSTSIKQWRQKQEAKDSLAQWEKTHLDSNSQLQDIWFKERDYESLLQQWVRTNFPQEESVGEWSRTDEGRTYYQKWINSPRAQRELLFSFKLSDDFATILLNWINQGLVPSYKEASPNPSKWEFNLWKILSSSQKLLLHLWEKSGDYQTSFDTWITSSNSLKATKQEWEKSSSSHLYFKEWLKTASAQKLISEEWNKFKASDANLKQLVPTSFAQWKQSNYVDPYFQTWSKSPTGVIELQKAWMQTNTGLNNYDKAMNEWIVDPNNIKQGGPYLDSQSAIKDYMEWRKLPEKRKILKKRWEKTQNYQDVYSKWLATQDHSNPDLTTPDFNDELDLWSGQLRANGKPIHFDLFEKHDWRVYYYQSHSQYNVDFQKWLTNVKGGQKEGLSLYLQSVKAQDDYQSWTPPTNNQGTLEDWKNQLVNDQTKVFTLYSQSPQSLTDYNLWIDPRDRENFSKKSNYSHYMDQWLEKDNNWFDAYVKILKWEKLYAKSDQFIKIDLPLYGDQLFTHSNFYHNNKGHSDWKDVMTNRYKTSPELTTTFNTWSVALDEDNVTNKMNLYIKGITQAQSDYQNWKLQQQKQAYQKDGQFNLDFNYWINDNDNVFNYYLTLAQSDADYNSWIDPQGEINYQSSNNYNLDFNAWKAVKTNGLGLYKNSLASQNDYQSWIDPHKPDTDDYAATKAYDLDLKLWTESVKGLSTNGKQLYKKEDQSQNDYQLWYESNKFDAQDYMQTTNYLDNYQGWITNYQSQPLIANNDELWNGLYQNWVDPLVRNKSNYILNNTTYNNNLNSFIFLNEKGIEKTFLSTPMALRIYNAWEDPEGVEPIEEDYFNSDEFIEDINEWSVDKNKGLQQFIDSHFAKSYF